MYRGRYNTEFAALVGRRVHLLRYEVTSRVDTLELGVIGSGDGFTASALGILLVSRMAYVPFSRLTSQIYSSGEIIRHPGLSGFADDAYISLVVFLYD